MRVFGAPAALAALISLSPSGAAAQGAGSDDQLRQEIEALREGQKAIQKDIEEIKRLLQGRAAAEALPREPISIAQEPSKGDKDARVAVIEFSDYECPFCNRYTRDVLPQLEAEYVKTGKVKYVFQDLPLAFHKNAFKAAEAAHCAGEQGRFWEMHDVLFQNQQALGTDQLGAHARAVGLAEDRFQQCLDSGRFAAEIRQDIAEAGQAGITGTPSFLVGVVEPGTDRVKIVKKLVGAKPYAEFKAAVDSALGTP